jgi:hypothetical protein
LPSTAGERARGLRDRPLGRVVILVAVLVAALLVARSCGATKADISKDEAIEIARGQVDYEPESVRIRLVKRGLKSNEIWLVGLAEVADDGSLFNVTNVIIDADSGEVLEVQRGA